MAFARVVELLARGRAGESARARLAAHGAALEGRLVPRPDRRLVPRGPAGRRAGPSSRTTRPRCASSTPAARSRSRASSSPSQGKGQALELRATRLAVVGWAGADYPLQKKRHGFEFLRTIAHLRPRTNTLGAVLRVRNVAARAVHRFFQERGFVWLHTPIITASDAEGAGAMFRVTATGEPTPSSSAGPRS